MLVNSWRCSTSIEEKLTLKVLGQNSECHRRSIQVVKTICKSEPTLETLTSFHLKTILFHIVDQSQSLSLTWGANDMYERVFDILGFIQQYLEAKKLPQFFLPSVDIFETSNFSESQLEIMALRIKNLRNCQDTFIEAINRL